MQFRHVNEAAAARRAASLRRVTEIAPPEQGVSRLPPPRPAPRLGRLLLDRGALGRAALGRALRLQRRSGGRLGEVLTAGGFVAPK